MQPCEDPPEYYPYMASRMFISQMTTDQYILTTWDSGAMPSDQMDTVRKGPYYRALSHTTLIQNVQTMER